MEVRAATEEDRTALRTLDRETWSPVVTPGPEPSDSDTSSFRPDGMLVAELDGELAGYIKLGRPTRLESNRHVLAIHGLAVDPRHQRRGVAQALIERAIEEAATRGAKRLTLRVLAPNTAARSLYESCGFEVEGVQREEFLLAGRYVDDVLMARRVP
jgi:ribosomal protein S18 acetylase RimI-like enzyme